MNIVELTEWKKNSQFIDSTDIDIDSSGNESWGEIYLNNGKYYQLNFMNGAQCSHYIPGRGVIHGLYVPQEVKKISKMVYQCEWEAV